MGTAPRCRPPDIGTAGVGCRRRWFARGRRSPNAAGRRWPRRGRRAGSVWRARCDPRRTGPGRGRTGRRSAPRGDRNAIAACRSTSRSTPQCAPRPSPTDRHAPGPRRVGRTPTAPAGGSGQEARSRRSTADSLRCSSCQPSVVHAAFHRRPANGPALTYRIGSAKAGAVRVIFFRWGAARGDSLGRGQSAQEFCRPVRGADRGRACSRSRPSGY